MGRKKKKIQEGWVEYRNAVYVTKSKSEDDFEKYINLMATGGIVLGFTFMEKIFSLTKVLHIWTIILGLFLLVITLLSNLYSHYKSMNDSDQIIKEVDNEEYDKIFKNSNKRNKTIRILNKISIWSFIIGCLLIMIFIITNLLNMNENNNNTPQPKDLPNLPKPDTGRINPTPPPTIKPKKQ